MTRSRWSVRPAVLFALATAAIGCGAPAPTGPCVADAPRVVSLPFQRLEGVSHEVDGGVEFAHFVFDPAAAGNVTVTVEPATPPYKEFNTGQVVAVQGHRVWSVRIEGLVGGAATDRVRVDVLDSNKIREIVQVADPEAFRWIVGTAAGACVRLRADEDAAIVVLRVTAE